MRGGNACPGDVRVEDLPEPTIQAPTDAIIRLAAARGADRTCGTTAAPTRYRSRSRGHEYVGVVEQVEWRSRYLLQPRYRPTPCN